MPTPRTPPSCGAGFKSALAGHLDGGLCNSKAGQAACLPGPVYAMKTWRLRLDLLRRGDELRHLEGRGSGERLEVGEDGVRRLCAAEHDFGL